MSGWFICSLTSQRLRLWNGEVRDEDIIEEAGRGIDLVDEIVGHSWPLKYRKQKLHRYLGFQVKWKSTEGEAPTNQTYESLEHTDALKKYLGGNPELAQDLEKAVQKAIAKSDSDSKRKTVNPAGESRRGKRNKKQVRTDLNYTRAGLGVYLQQLVRTDLN